MGVRQYARYVGVVTASGYASGHASGSASGMHRGTHQVITLSVKIGEEGLDAHPVEQMFAKGSL